MRSTFPLKALALVSAAALTAVEARAPSIQRYANSVIGTYFYASYQYENPEAGGSGLFGLWTQRAEKSLGPIFKTSNREKFLAIIIPNNAAVGPWIISQGGNYSDPETLSTPEWDAKWNDVWPFFFGEAELLASELTNSTTVVNSYKTSPAGNWPLRWALRRGNETASLDASVAYNGTMYSTPYGSGTVVLPDFSAGDHAVAQMVDYWPSEPQFLSKTMAHLGLSAWASIADRLPTVLALENQNNFTLFLPPQAVLASALRLSDDDLLAFVEAHLVAKDVYLSESTQTVPTASGATIAVSLQEVTEGTRVARIIERDILTNGGTLQLISQSLVALPSLTARSEL